MTGRVAVGITGLIDGLARLRIEHGGAGQSRTPPDSTSSTTTQHDSASVRSTAERHLLSLVLQRQIDRGVQVRAGYRGTMSLMTSRMIRPRGPARRPPCRVLERLVVANVLQTFLPIAVYVDVATR